MGDNPEGRPENDYYPTPPRGTIALLEVEKFEGAIWECACGSGSMSSVLEHYGYNVVSTDLEPRGYGTQLDFLTAQTLLAPNIVTNPPFTHSMEFAAHALRLGAIKVAMLNKIQFLEGGKRVAQLSRTPLARVWVFKDRLTIFREGREAKRGGMMTFAWFVWEKGYIGKPEIGWV